MTFVLSPHWHKSDIDSTLATLDKTLSHYDVVQDEEPLIRKGPRPDDIRPYMDTIDRVRKGLEYLKRSDLRSQERVMQDMVSGRGNLVEHQTRDRVLDIGPFRVAQPHRNRSAQTKRHRPRLGCCRV